MQRVHGVDAKVIGVRLHADEAVVAWNGACYEYPIRVFIHVRGGGRSWESIGLIPHIPKVVGNRKYARARQAVSDARNDMLQRCLAVTLKRCIHASVHGTRVALPGRGCVLLVPRVVGLVDYEVQVREMLGLMSHQSIVNCPHCLVGRDESCYFRGQPSPPRSVMSTLESQVTATLSREAGGRPRVRVALASSMTALPFVPVLGAVHVLWTGQARLYDMVSLDTLHVWKLGVLRTLAQGLPGMLQAVCDGESAIEGTVPDTLDALNLRGFELGRQCRASPAPSGYVFSLSPPPPLLPLRSVVWM